MSLREDMAVLRAYRRAGLERHYWDGTASLWPQSRVRDAIEDIPATPDISRLSFSEELAVRGE